MGTALVVAAYAVFPEVALVYQPDNALRWVLIGALAAGLAFTWWARIHLGELWSVSVTRKDNHRVVQSGPYTLVRHPIYTGLLIALAATAAAKGSALAFAGLALFAIGFVVKARLEERFLREELGPEYDAYAARVPMLVPFWPTRRRG
jgi:protein-S-isoprenylcysteine O-methyltransferase Ste14